YRLCGAFKMDSLSLRLHFLSDSVMLLQCGKNDAVFIKYYLQSDGILHCQTSNFQCTEFVNESEEKLYQLLSGGKMNFRMEGNGFLIGGKECAWKFRLE
ncbi:MAG: hypothetical protein LPK45_11215, partial [Bacteroidota bacterium]|nr:hypothetical protein [Bacteroidota bacterium]MDX5431675.1 hypothetical protein [Bacteroidota bacterium]MDX5470390.1 hypothetical protein [Bacteroidota bacterium]